MVNKEKLIETAARLVTPPRGILAIDESNNSCNKRFENLGVLATEEKRREYRELLITTPDIEKYISGFILFDETIRQSTRDGKNFTSVLQEKGIDIGIKVDQGLVDFPNHVGEKITQGLDGLKERLQEYKNMGATFAKWRVIYQIGENTPSEELLKENANSLAKYASICQELDIVPLIEPEVLFDGTHTIEKCYEVMAHNFDIIFAELLKHEVFIPGIILKTSMVLAGKDAKEKSSHEVVARMTIKCLEEHVPSFIGGIVFLSGGQTGVDAMLNLNTMHCCGPLTWPLTFSYSRAIQNLVLESWAKNPEDVTVAQNLLLEAARNNSLASIGQYPSSRTSSLRDK
ncbi:MAG: class I fructose-bisphosphate aldolase [Candidatus Paceibacterota bacterium]|jgi:fructose-bisphosphate aldolase class I